MGFDDTEDERPELHKFDGGWNVRAESGVRKDTGEEFHSWKVTEYLGKDENDQGQFKAVSIPRYIGFGKQIDLTPESAMKLVKGEVLETELESAAGNPYPVSVFVSEIKSRPKTVNGKTYDNLLAVSTTAINQTKEDGSIQAYRFIQKDDHPVTVFKTVGNVSLSAKECYDLTQGKEVEIKGEVFKPGERTLYDPGDGKKPSYTQKVSSENLARKQEKTQGKSQTQSAGVKV